MNYIKKRLKKKTEDISFIQIKDDSKIKNIDYNITGIPLPILTDSLVHEVKNEDLEEIGFDKIIDGIIYLLGIGDLDFPHIDKYKDILNLLSTNIEDAIFFKAMTFFKEDDIDNSLLNIRALLELNPKNIKGLFQYGIILESIGKILLEEGNIDEGEMVLKDSTLKFERILDLDDKYSLAYYKLGYHYRHLEQYVKADIIWKKFLKFSNDEFLKKEVREELDLIKDDANFEAALSYMAYGHYQKALDSLLSLLPKHQGSWNVNYLIAKCYKGLGEVEAAIEHFNIAIKHNQEEAELYNELGTMYYNIGDIHDALKIFSEGVRCSGEDYKLIFNKSLMHAALKEYEIALKDAERAFELNPDSNIGMQINWLKDQI